MKVLLPLFFASALATLKDSADAEALRARSDAIGCRTERDDLIVFFFHVEEADTATEGVVTSDIDEYLLSSPTGSRDARDP